MPKSKLFRAAILIGGVFAVISLVRQLTRPRYPRGAMSPQAIQMRAEFEERRREHLKSLPLTSRLKFWLWRKKNRMGLSKSSRISDRSGNKNRTWPPEVVEGKSDVSFVKYGQSNGIRLEDGACRIRFGFAFDFDPSGLPGGDDNPIVEVVLFRALSFEGPYEEVKFTKQQIRDPLRDGENARCHPGVSDDAAAEAGRNELWYRLSLIDADNRLIADLAPVRMPVVRLPSIADWRLRWQAVDPESEPPDASFFFNLSGAALFTPAPIKLAKTLDVPLSVVLRSVKWQLYLECKAPGGRENRALGHEEFREIPYETERIPVHVRVPSPSADGTPQRVACVVPHWPGDGRVGELMFHYLPGRTSFKRGSPYWADAPGKSAVRNRLIGEAARTLVVDFVAPGSEEEHSLELRLPGFVPRLRGIAGNGEVTLLWDADAVVDGADLVDGAPELVLYRDYHEVAAVPLSDGRYVDQTAVNNHTYQYHAGLRCRLGAQMWMAGQGESDHALEANCIPPLEQGNGVSVYPNAYCDRLTVSLAMSELCYNGSGKAHLLARMQVVKALLKQPGVLLLDRFNVPSMLRELALDTMPLTRARARLAVPARFVLRFADRSGPEGGALDLWLTDLSSLETERIGSVPLPVRSSQASSKAFVAPLLARIKGELPKETPAPEPGQSVKRFLFGPLYPVEQEKVFRDGAALADALSVALAEQLPDAEVLTRQDFGAVMAERARLAQDGSIDGSFPKGDVLLSGRVWRVGDDDVGLSILATSLRTGQVLDTWQCAREAADSVERLAEWCATLRAPPAHDVGADAKPCTAHHREAQLPSINPHFALPRAARQGRERYLSGKAAHGWQTVLKEAEAAWKAGKRVAAMEQLESAWLKRGTATDAVHKSTLLQIGLTLSRYYREQQEYAGEATVTGWLVAEAEKGPPPRGQDLDSLRRAHMRAKLRAKNSDRARELAARKRTAPADSSASGAEQGRPAIAAADKFEPRVERVVLSEPLPADLIFDLRREPTKGRYPEDPLYAVRPTLGRPFPGPFDWFAATYARHVMADRKAFAVGLRRMQELRRAAVQNSPAVRGLWVEVPRRRGGWTRFSMEMIRRSSPMTTAVFTDPHQQMFLKYPYLCSHALRKAGPDVYRPILEPLVEETAERAARYESLRRDQARLVVVGWPRYLAVALLAESGDPAARKLCTTIRRQAGFLLDELTALGKGEDHERQLRDHDNGPFWSSALLILAHMKRRGARELCSNELYLKLFLASQQCSQADVLRFLLDIEADAAFPLAMAQYSSGSFSACQPHEFLWRSDEEVVRLIEKYPRALRDEDLKELLAGVGMTPAEIDKRLARPRVYAPSTDTGPVRGHFFPKASPSAGRRR